MLVRNIVKIYDALWFERLVNGSPKDWNYTETFNINKRTVVSAAKEMFLELNHIFTQISWVS